MTPKDSLDLRTLSKGIPALTPARGRFHAEAAALCLVDMRHRQGVPLQIDCSSFEAPCKIPLKWPRVTSKTRAAYADRHEATEQGAVGVAIALMRKVTNLVAVSRASKTTGIDYWMGDSSTRGGLMFQNKARLEISGIMKAPSRTAMSSREAQKQKQTQRSDDSRLPAYVVVVEFSTPKAGVSVR